MCKRAVHVSYGSTLAELPYACLVQPIQDTKLSRITSYSVLSIYWHPFDSIEHASYCQADTGNLTSWISSSQVNGNILEPLLPGIK